MIKPAHLTDYPLCPQKFLFDASPKTKLSNTTRMLWWRPSLPWGDIVRNLLRALMMSSLDIDADAL
jgi:hypothetical protein